jgi:glycosyltransferase involved in cell wall biosynthesis
MFDISGVGAGGQSSHLPQSPIDDPLLALALEHPLGFGAPAIAPGGAAYEGDMHAAAERYARLCVALVRTDRGGDAGGFDCIHAHDWMTFPAGIALAHVTGKPLVIHVHSTEFDRSGENVDQRVYNIERRGMHAAARVICVSNLTQSICVRRYGVDPGKCQVVYNGVDNEAAQPRPEGGGDRIEAKDRIVLFLGRITMQKGPEYFIRAAKRVLEKEPNAKFVVAGSGDMAIRMIEEAAYLGIGSRVLFTGFLRGRDVDRIYRMADVYVMPSVSEPFGIAPLEAMRNDVPVIISKQSGVSEVLTHALKVDFWDIDEMANKIVAVLRHPPLGQTLREHGSFELRRLTWDGAAQRCVRVYASAIGHALAV